MVIHEEDGFQILCDKLHEATTPIVIHLNDFISAYPELSGIQFLKKGHLMERIDDDSPWVIKLNTFYID